MASNNLFGRVIKVTVKGKLTTTFSNDTLEIRFNNTFDDDPKPNETKVDIYNLSKDSIHRIFKNDICTLQAGYRSDYGVIASGRISSILTKKDGVDKITTITFIEGEDYSHKKVTAANADPAKTKMVKKRVKVNGKYKTITEKKTMKQALKITFKPGTTGKTIITRLCGVLGIKIAEFKLPKNKVYKKGYVVSGLIENNLEEVVRDCGASMYYRRGKMVIRSIKEGNDEKFTIEESTGLIESPEPFDDESGKGYKVKCLLQHRITTASIVKIKSHTANGKFRVRSGKHYYDGNDFVSEVEVI